MSTTSVAVATQTKTKVITHTKIAVAVMFLGFASLAASAVGLRVEQARAIPFTSLPDLKIKKIVFNPSDSLIKVESLTTDPETDRVAIYYRNVGETPVWEPFNIKVTFNPAPYIQGIAAQLLPEQPGIPDILSYKEVSKFETGVYIFQVNSKTGDSSSIKNLNRYHLAKNQDGRIEFTIPKYYRQMLGNGTLTITAEIDDDGYDGIIAEYNETNNDFSSYILYSEIENKKGNACNAGKDATGGNWMLDTCRESKLLYSCVDRYRFSFIGCGATEDECLERAGDVIPCKTGSDFVVRPTITNVGLWIVTKTYSMDFSRANGDYATTTFLFDPIHLGQDFKITVDVANATTSTMYGYYIDEKPISLMTDIRSIEKRIVWKDKPEHTFKTRLKSFSVHVFVRKGDKAGALKDEMMVDVDDATSAIFKSE